MIPTVIIDAVRSPFGRRGGGLAEIHPADLLADVLSALLARNDLDPAEVGHLVAGCVEKTGEQGFNIARTAGLTAGLPPSVPATTVDVQCGSSQEAFTIAHALVASGLVSTAIAAGVESMSRVPMGHTFTSGPGSPIPASYLERFEMPDQFAAAERIATRWGLSRDDCDELALTSVNRATSAWETGAFDAQTLPVAGVSADECIRATSREALAGLRTLADGGVHTAATASKIADGASAVLLTSAERAASLGLSPMAEVLDSVLVGVEPELMLTGPITATQRLLERNPGLGVLDFAEINEAFASVVLAWQREVGAAAKVVNPTGGALAIGHPLGATGTGLITKAVHHLAGLGSGTALVSMCCGGSLGTGTLLAR